MKFLLEHAAAGLFADPGCRKTSITYGAFKILRKKGLARKMLVIAPLRVARLVWPAEARKWAEFNDLRVEVLHGPKKSEALARDADVYVVNYDGLSWLLGATTSKTPSGRVSVSVDLKAFAKLGFDTLVCDEISKLKSHQSGRHKAVKAISGTFARRWGLTGSPAANGLEGLFGQILILDQGRSFGPYITHYRAKYFLPSYDGFGYVLRKGAEEEIYARLRPLVLRLEATDLPALVEVVTRFDLPPDARKIYDTMEEIMIARLGEEVVVAANAGVASIKCRQIANGGLYRDPDVEKLLRGRKAEREWVNLHDAKTDLVEELLDELQGKPLLVAYDFRHDLDRLRKRFGKREDLVFEGDLPILGAGVTPRREAAIEAAWNRGELPLLLGHPQSVGHGLNLQGSGNAHVAFYAGTFDEELHDQFLRRVRRNGNTAARVFAHYLLARDTVDEVMFWAVRAKERNQKKLLDALKNVRAGRK
jgi:SNF2 family DNA or RNA helicase